MLPVVAILALSWGWSQTHWSAATLIVTPPKETVRWSYNKEPCAEITSYFQYYGFDIRFAPNSSSGEFKENALLLQSCWPKIQRLSSKILQKNIAGNIIPKEYFTEKNASMELVQHFYPSLRIPDGGGTAAKATVLYQKLASQLQNGDNTEQVRALQYSCQSPILAQQVQRHLVTENLTSGSRAWYVAEMLQHCRLSTPQRQAYMKQQWVEHPDAHAFLMLEWHLYHKQLPDSFQPSDDPIEQAIFSYLSDISYTTTH